MKKSRYVYVSFEGLWRMTRKDYVSFLMEASKGEGFDPSQFGKLVTTEVIDLRGLGGEDFRAMLGAEEE